jgi:uncharacterized membrane protein YbaN (DUF454 family)
MQCKQCGADLPEEARFCLQCGAPTQRPEEPPLEPRRPEGPAPELDFVQPALVGGALLGLLSSLPVISAGNCLCCMWVLGGGGLSTYMLAKQQPGRRLTYGDGAFAGVLSGLFGAIIATIVSIPVKIVSAPFLKSQEDQVEEMLRNMPEMEGWLRDLLTRAISPEVSVSTVLFNFLSYLIMFALFAMIGGILAVVILQKRGARPVSQAPLR